MTDATPPEMPSAGAMLRAAREKQGMHIAVLAASIKVAKPKLEALENDRYDELPDMTFTRALALTVCRALKIDAEPVLARLPQAAGHRLEPIGSGLNAPFRERPGRLEPSDWTLLNKPAFWAVALVLLAAAVLYLLPEDFLRGLRDGVNKVASPSAPASPPASASAPVALPAASAPPAVLVETVHSAPAAASDAAPAGIAVLRTNEESWVEVQDGNDQMLLSRTLLAGETVGLDGKLPLRVKIGNASATELSFRGQTVDLVPATRDNIARLELR
jgi:cytoskeleton protein RodZ